MRPATETAAGSDVVGTAFVEVDAVGGRGESNLNCDASLLATGAGVDCPTGGPMLKLCDEKLYADVVTALTDDWMPAAVSTLSVVGKPNDTVDERIDGFAGTVLPSEKEANGCGCFDRSTASFCFARLKA